uniref:Nucleoside diphosphate kinase homolog 7 n=1 Tax=Nothobranchius furzeri TaxID=105023 RepID=A0A8C6KV20_NOTFU
MEDRYAFLAEWFDQHASLLRRFLLFFYITDGSVEMYDLKNRKKYLKRTKCDSVNQEDLFVGNRLNIFSRQLHLVDYGDQFTANKLGSEKERTLALIKPDMVSKIGDILELINASKLMVTKAKMTKLTWSQAEDFYVEHQSKPFFSALVHFMSSGPVVAMELVGDKALSIWRELLGPADSAVALTEAPQSIRAQFGTDAIKNVAHGSDSIAVAARELEFFFPSTVGHGPSNTALFTDCTCCIIKPHAVSAGLTGKILNSISAAGFEISALGMALITELCSGPCMALEIHGADAPRTFREFCGPPYPEIARLLRPNTLRALYGTDNVKTAVHCTDLPEDGILEVEFFFKILDR